MKEQKYEQHCCVSNSRVNVARIAIQGFVARLCWTKYKLFPTLCNKENLLRAGMQVWSYKQHYPLTLQRNYVARQAARLWCLCYHLHFCKCEVCTTRRRSFQSLQRKLYCARIATKQNSLCNLLTQECYAISLVAQITMASKNYRSIIHLINGYFIVTALTYYGLDLVTLCFKI